MQVGEVGPEGPRGPAGRFEVLRISRAGAFYRVHHNPTRREVAGRSQPSLARDTRRTARARLPYRDRSGASSRIDAVTVICVTTAPRRGLRSPRCCS